MKAGYVYVLSNPSMPFLVKIGYSKHGGQSRATTFYRNDTAVATPFNVEFEVLCDDARKIERLVHVELESYRVNPSREFFECGVSMAAKTISKFLSESIEAMPDDYPKYVELDFEEGGIYHEMTSIGDSQSLNITQAEYAEAARRLTWDIDLLTKKVLKLRESKKNSEKNGWFGFRRGQ